LARAGEERCSVRPHIGLEITPAIRLIRAIGAGGMGSVWVGHHSGLSAEVAVKFLSADLATSEGAQQRFADEASAAAQIKSPHVVQVHDHGVFAGELPFIVMELLEGEHLANRVWRGGPLDLPSTTTVVLQLGHALAKAHAAGIVHRDVKPENVVLLDGYGEMFLKLIDFGVAKRLSGGRALTLSGAVVGTPDFMCPEQLLSSRDVGPAVDAWALAAVAYYALVGVAPFARETIPATFLAIERGDFVLPFQGHGIGSQALDAFFVRALSRDPAGRFESLGELVNQFCAAATIHETRTLRSEVASSGERRGTLEIAAGSGAWLTSPQVAVRQTLAPVLTPPQGITRVDAALAYRDEAPSSAVVPRGAPTLLSETPAPEDSRHLPAVTTTDRPELEAQDWAGRSRRRLTMGVAVGAMAVGGTVAFYLRPAPARGGPDDQALVPSAEAPAPAPAEPVATWPHSRPAAPALFVGDTLPVLEERPAPPPPESGVVGVGGTAEQSGELPEEPPADVQYEQNERAPARVRTPRRASSRTLDGPPAGERWKDRGF
jgi:serine/threonine protein kinase